MTETLQVKVDKGSGDVLVLLHGLGNNYKSWTYVLKEIDYTKQRVVALDLLGFGDSPKPSKSEYTPEDHANAVIATLDKLGITTATIAGHSMGCIVAIAVAAKRPKLVRRLVLLGAPLYKKMPRARLFRLKFWRIENAYATIFKLLAKNPDITITAAKSLKIFAPLLKGMEITEETWPAFRKSLQNSIVQVQSYKDALHLQIPTLLMYGKLDIFVIKRNLKRLARQNRKYITFRSVLGPHEITPLHGKSIAELLEIQTQKS